MEAIREIQAEITAIKVKCETECRAYKRWRSLLSPFNFLFVGIGSGLSFLGGAEIISQSTLLSGNITAGYMAVSGGLLTGLHKWLNCDSHQAKCTGLMEAYIECSLECGEILSETSIEEARLGLKRQTSIYHKLMVKAVTTSVPAFLYWGLRTESK